MRIAIIGGGSRVARGTIEPLRAIAPGVELVAFGRAGSELPTDIAAVRVADYEAVTADLLKDFDVAVNFVGTASSKNKALLEKLNVSLPSHLLEAARAAGVRHFVHVSSLSVHGRAALIDAETPVKPVTPYGRSKARGDAALLAAEGGILLTLLRIPILYGPGTRSKLDRLVRLFSRLPIFPVPRRLPGRSIIGFDNLARGLADLLTRPRAGLVYLADPQPFDYGLLRSIMPSGPRFISVPPAALAPLRALSPTLYASLYEPMEIAPDALLTPARFELLPTAVGLARAFDFDCDRARC